MKLNLATIFYSLLLFSFTNLLGQGSKTNFLGVHSELKVSYVRHDSSLNMQLNRGATLSFQKLIGNIRPEVYFGAEILRFTEGDPAKADYYNLQGGKQELGVALSYLFGKNLSASFALPYLRVGVEKQLSSGTITENYSWGLGMANRSYNVSERITDFKTSGYEINFTPGVMARLSKKLLIDIKVNLLSFTETKRVITVNNGFYTKNEGEMLSVFYYPLSESYVNQFRAQLGITYQF